MAKAIYSLKLYIFKDQFDLNSKEEKALKDICCFIVKCYVQAWFSSPNAIEAPLNDILFLNKLEEYKLHIKRVADVALKKIINHLWYLNSECVTFSIFDDRVDNSTKLKMAERILSTYDSSIEDDEEIELKKKIALKLEDVSHFIRKDLLIDLINSKSIGMFKRFEISTQFLTIDPANWNNHEDYIIGKQIINSLKVVNDTAERGVKLIEEYNKKFTKNEEQKPRVLQVIYFTIFKIN
jgi:hypothetical protein